MAKLLSNPYLDSPISAKRILLMTLSAITFISEVIYGTIRGFVWFGIGRETKNESKFNLFHEMICNFMKLNCNIHPWISCEIKNPYNESFKNGAIAVCNHQSLIDTLCLLILSPKILIAANRKVIYNPIVRILLHYAEFVCVDKRIDYLIDYCDRQTKRGYTVVFFPEGLRSKHCDIRRFHTGAFYIANKLKIDILPLYLHGTGYFLPFGKAFQNNVAMSIEIGKRIRPNLNSFDVREQTRMMRSHYNKHYDKICRETENTCFFKQFVISLFETINKGRETKRILAKYDNFSQWIDCDFKIDNIYIEDRTNGVFTLMFALVHPNTYISTTNNTDLESIYKGRKNLPRNISFKKEKSFLSNDKYYEINNMVIIYKI
ncbi:MAG: lysophospholipid acyltransferase family protein [Prevotella sp.]|nr:lysophospholipid acyltransferase family protein [Prevotella sp.]